MNNIDSILYLISILVPISSVIFSFLPDPFYTKGWLILTYLGSSTAYIVYGLIIYYLGDCMNAYKIIITLMIGGWMNTSLKNIFKMPRPINPKIHVSGYSFPSGHAESSTTFWSSLCLLYPRKAILIASIVISIIVSISRVALNVHYPRDVIFGGFIGFLTGLSLIYLLNKVMDRNVFIYIHIFLSIVMFLTYQIYNDLMLIKFSGFLLGGILHPVLYYKYGNISEGRIEQIIKFISSFIIIIWLSSLGHEVGLVFALSVLMGIVIPVIKFIL